MRQITLHRYRYVVGFGVLALLVLVLAIWRFWSLPNGLTSGEMSAAAAAGHFSLSQILTNVVNLPWTVLEWLSIRIFGASTFAFRLPAVILMILAAGGLVLFLKNWYRANIAVIGGFLIVSSVLFMSLSRSGTAAAMTTFLIVAILWSALTVIRAVEEFGQGTDKNKVRRGWRTFLAKIILCVALALLSYQAAGIYLVALFVVVGLIHPKTRLIFVKSKPWKIIVGTLAGLAVVAPLVLGLISGGWAAIQQWLVLDGAWSLEHLRSVGAALFGFESGFSGGFVTPIIALAGLILACLGLMNIGAHIFSARSYLVVVFLLATLVLAVWQPALVYLLFVPLALLLAVGLETLIGEWYGLFPRNPYARILGFVILTILLVGLVWTSVSRFALSQNYDAAVIDNYHQEYSAVRTVLSKEKGPVTLVAAPKDQSLYQILQREFPNLTVTNVAKKDARNLIVVASAPVKIQQIPRQIVTNSRIKNAVLVRVY